MVVNIAKQLALLFAVCVAGDLLSTCIGGFLPGNVLGMVLLLLLLCSGRLRTERLREVSDFFEQNMAFFFLPACLGVLELPGEVRAVLGPILVIVVLSTLLTGVVTAATVKLVSGWTHKGKAASQC